MATQVTQKELFIESLNRCTATEGFVDSFYDRFMAKSDVVREKFENTDFSKQNKMLVRSLELVAAATKGESAGLMELRERARTHDRNHLDIEPKLYDLWQSSIIETASHFDSHWDDQTEAAWNQILSYVVGYMKRRY